MILYHGTVDDAAVKIMTNNHFIQSNGKKHLLGKGIYLYDNLNLALNLARKKAFEKNQEDSPTLSYKPIVLKVEVDVHEEGFMDLDILEAQDLFFNNRMKFVQLLRQKGFLSEYYTDSLFCDFLCNLLEIKMLAKTMVTVNPSNTCTTRYTQDPEIDKSLTTHYPTEKIYCVKDSSWISHISYGRVGDL